MEFGNFATSLPWPRSCTSAGRPAPPDQPAAAQPADPRPGARARGRVLIRGRSIELTEAGRVLLEHGRSASEAVTYAVQAAREAGEGMTRLRVGYPAGAASASVPLAVRIFRERFPSVALDTVVGQAGAHLAALAARQLDVAFVRLPAATTWPSGPCTASPSTWPSPSCTRWPGCAPSGLGISPASRSSCSRGRSTRRSTTTWCTTSWPAAVSPSVVLEATTLESSLVAVAGGLGIAFAAESAAGQFTVRGVEFAPGHGGPAAAVRRELAA